MSLLKKTLVLSGQPPKGYLTILKIGTTGGLKLTLGNVSPEMLLAVKVGEEKPISFPIRALKEEFILTSNFDEKTQIQAVIFLNGTVYTHTGNAPAFLIEECIADVKKDNTANEAPKTAKLDSETEQFANNEPPRHAKVERETADFEVVSEGAEQFQFFQKQTDAHFYDRVRARMDEMLAIHPREESLERLIPDSKWVKVPYSQDEFYVVGTLSDGNGITHIGYGVRGIRSVLPPKEAEALSEFLPTNGDDGYWLMFQDAGTGEMLPID